MLQALFVPRYNVAMNKPKAPPKKTPGRPRVEDGVDTVTMNIRFSVAQREKIERNGGGSWVRGLVDRAKDKAPVKK